MRAWFAAGVVVALAVISFAVMAGDAPPKRHIGWWDAMMAWQGPPKQEQQKQEEPKREPTKAHWGWLKKPKPQPCGCYAGGEAVNYPPYDPEP